MLDKNLDDAITDLIDEFDNLMQAGLDEIAVDDKENAEEYFADACFVLRKIPDDNLRKELSQKYEINPYDYER